MNADIIRFQAGVPIEGCLKYPTGKEVQGRFGDQKLFTLEDGARFYLDLPQARQLEELGLRRGEAFSILKREARDGNRKSVEWLIGRTLEGQLAASVEQLPACQSAPAVQATPQPAPAQHAPVAAQQPAYASADSSDLMTAALIASINSCQAAEAYARERGLPLKFSEQNIQAIAATIYIQHSRQAVTSWRQ